MSRTASQKFEENLMMKSHVRRLSEVRSSIRPNALQPSQPLKNRSNIDRLIKVYEPISVKPNPTLKTPAKPTKPAVPDVLRRFRAGLPPIDHQTSFENEVQLGEDEESEETAVEAMLVRLPHSVNSSVSQQKSPPNVRETGAIRSLRSNRSNATSCTRRPQSLSSVIPRHLTPHMMPPVIASFEDDDSYTRPSNLAELRAVKAAVNSIIKQESERHITAAIQDEERALSLQSSSSARTEPHSTANSSAAELSALASVPGPTPHWLLNKLHFDTQVVAVEEDSVALVKDAAEELDEWYFSQSEVGLAAHSALYTLVQGLDDVHTVMRESAKGSKRSLDVSVAGETKHAEDSESEGVLTPIGVESEERSLLNQSSAEVHTSLCTSSDFTTQQVHQEIKGRGQECESSSTVVPKLQHPSIFEKHVDLSKQTLNPSNSFSFISSKAPSLQGGVKSLLKAREARQNIQNKETQNPASTNSWAQLTAEVFR